jgi:hypothetical protein
MYASAGKAYGLKEKGIKAILFNTFNDEYNLLNDDANASQWIDKLHNRLVIFCGLGKA